MVTVINDMKEGNEAMKASKGLFVQVSKSSEGFLEDMPFEPRSKRPAAANSMKRGMGLKACERGGT